MGVLLAERDYSRRDVVDKLGVKAGDAVAFDEVGWQIDEPFRQRVIARTGRLPAGEGEPIDVALVALDASVDPIACVRRWKARLKPAGGIWLLTPKRGFPGYVRQESLIDAGPATGLVDNKVCSVSDTTSAIRFVIRRADRGTT